jgi:hypothetical protein
LIKEKNEKENKSLHFSLEGTADMFCFLSRLFPLVLVVTGTASGGQTCTSSLGCRQGLRGWAASNVWLINSQEILAELFWDCRASVDNE